VIIGWDPATAGVRTIAAEQLIGWMIDRTADEVVWDNLGTVYRRRGGAAVEPWFGLPSDARLHAIDAGAHRFAWEQSDAFRVVDLDRRDVWSLQVWAIDACGVFGTLKLERGSTRFAIGNGLAIERFDLDGRRRLGTIELPDAYVGAWDLVPGTGELVMATAGEVMIWRPGDPTARRWVPPIARGPSELAVDATGTELAVAYEDGSLLWVNLAGLRAHGTPRPVVERAIQDHAECATTAIDQPALDDLLRAPDASPISGILD
jgi:hypothetical protein